MLYVVAVLVALAMLDVLLATLNALWRIIAWARRPLSQDELARIAEWERDQLP